MKVLHFNDPYVDSKGNVNNLGNVLSDSSLKESVDKLNSNLSNKTKFFLEIGDIRWSDGGNIESTTWKRSGFVKVTPNTKYILNRTLTGDMNIIGYKENKTAITDGSVNGSGIAHKIKTTEYEFITTTTTNYIRIAISDTDLSENITLTNNGIGNTVVELVEDVAELKNDLIVLEATSSIDMISKKELDDRTTALTIPTGYKPIAMYGYNEENNDNVTVVPLLIRSDGKILFHAKNYSSSDQGIIHFFIRVTCKKIN